jgi:micrococcal nuclease
MLGRRYTRGGLGSLVLLIVIAFVVFGQDGDDSPPGRAPGSSSHRTADGPKPALPGATRQRDPSHPNRRDRPRGVQARVTRVVDGDTVEVLIGGREEDVRYIGVDTPETVKPGTPIQCYGRQASAFNHRLVEGRTVRIVFDRERRDVYGRLLGYVYLSGEFVNAELVRRGYARTLTIAPNDTFAPLLASLQSRAGREGRGLWGACPP